jgi:hypothetical protein
MPGQLIIHGDLVKRLKMSGISTNITLNRLEQLELVASESNFKEKPIAHAR